jgi:hypothetical protein
MIVLEHLMATPAPRKRRSADPQTERTIKTSLIPDVELHTKLAAAAAMQGVDRNALAVGILSDALRGIVVMDRRKGADRFKTVDRPSGVGEISSDAEDEAA